MYGTVNKKIKIKKRIMCTGTTQGFTNTKYSVAHDVVVKWSVRQLVFNLDKRSKRAHT